MQLRKFKANAVNTGCFLPALSPNIRKTQMTKIRATFNNVYEAKHAAYCAFNIAKTQYEDAIVDGYNIPSEAATIIANMATGAFMGMVANGTFEEAIRVKDYPSFQIVNHYGIRNTSTPRGGYLELMKVAFRYEVMSMIYRLYQDKDTRHMVKDAWDAFQISEEEQRQINSDYRKFHKERSEKMNAEKIAAEKIKPTSRLIEEIDLAA